MLKQRSFLRAIDVLNLAYVTLIGLLILAFNTSQDKWGLYFLIHVGLFIGQYAFFRFTAFSTSRWIRFLRDAATPVLLIYYYEETELLNHMVVNGFLDPFFAGLEEAIFGFQPALEFYHLIPHPLFSEYMHFSYFSYYLLIPGLGLPLWLMRRHKQYDQLIFSCLLCMSFCFTFFIFVPCAGPWHYFTEGIMRWNFPGYVFVPAMEMVLKYGEIANGAFPSSHVAMATVILFCAWRYHRLIFWIMLPFVISLYASTVYTQAHYLIDVPSGFLVGWFFFMIGDRVKRWMEERFNLRVSDNEIFERKTQRENK